MSNFWHKLPKPIIALAPMAGYTYSAFRQLCHEFGADVVYSEMISVDGLCYKNKKTLDMLKYSPSEYPLVFQLFGNQPNKFAQAVKIINNLTAERSKLGIDINLGCPAPKITRSGSGASLMNEIDKAYKIIETVCQNTPLPVSIKIRSKVKNISAVQFIKKVKELPWTTVMIHGRSLSQGFSGPVDFETIKKIKRLLPDKFVLGNGGITDIKTALESLEQTQADGLGIARGAWGNPWIFQELKKEFTLSEARRAKGPVDSTINWNIRKKTIIKHAKLFLKENNNLIPLRKHLVHYVKAQKNASQLRQRLIKIETLAQLENILSEFKN
jgi:tRNA-dihydrouridine synthase B